MIPVITTKRLTLGPFLESHLDALAEFFADDRSRFVGGPKSREETWRHIALELGHWEMRGFGRFAVTETSTGALVGNIGPWFPEGWPEREIGWDLMNGFEGRGYATEAAAAARLWCYEKLGWRTAVSYVDPENTGSAQLAARLGAVHDGDTSLPVWGKVQRWRHPGPDALGALEVAV